MEEKKYKAFTLIEMLIVMGIIMILIGVGVVGTRYALNSANKIKHQNAVDSVNQAFIAYYSDYRDYPSDSSTLKTLLSSGGKIEPYLDSAFDGGADANYYFWSDTDKDLYVVCVSLGGVNDADISGYYCNGNGFGSDYSGVSEKNIDNGSSESDTIETDFVKSVWSNGGWSS